MLFRSRIWIRPGSLAYTDVFLDSSLVTVEWEVREITIEDRYEIILNPIFNTSVTEVARIVVSPMSLTLPPMRAGQEMNGEVTLTNQGDLGAQKLALSMPGENRYFRYELLGEVPENLGPRQTVTLPYRVTCLKDFAPDDCVRLQAQAGVRYMFLCVNGHESWQATGWVWYANHGLCQAPPSGPGEYSGGGGGDHGGGGPGGGPVIVTPAPAGW